MSVVERPARVQPRASELALGESEAVGGIGGNGIVLGVVAGGILVAVLEEVNVVAEPGKAHEVVKLPPRHPAQRSADNVAEHDDAKLHARANPMSSWIAPVATSNVR